MRSAHGQTAAGGLLAAVHVGGEMEMEVVHGVQYFAPDGTQTGILEVGWPKR